MTFPSVKGVSYGHSAGAQNFTIPFPGEAQPGDLLIIATSSDTNPTLTWPSGWSLLKADVDAAAQVRLEVYYRVMQAGDSWARITKSAANNTTWHCYAITGHDASTTAPEAGADTDGNSASLDPPNLDPAGWGTEDTLWLAIAAYDQGQRFITAFPTNYTGTRYSRYDSTAGTGIAFGYRQLNASSENPGSFTLSTGDNWVATTIAIRPGSEGGTLSDPGNSPYVVGIGDPAHGAGDITPTLPSGWATDDLLLLFVETAAQANATPSGWNASIASPSIGAAGGATGTQLAIYWKQATSSETDPTVVDNGEHQYGRIMAIRGVDSTVLANWKHDIASGTISANATLTATSFTTSLNNVLILVAGTRTGGQLQDYTGCYDNYANTNLTSKRLWSDQSFAADGGGGIGIMAGVMATAGAVGSTTASDIGASATNRVWVTLGIQRGAIARGRSWGYIL